MDARVQDISCYREKLSLCILLEIEELRMPSIFTCNVSEASFLRKMID